MSTLVIPFITGRAQYTSDTSPSCPAKMASSNTDSVTSAVSDGTLKITLLNLSSLLPAFRVSCNCSLLFMAENRHKRTDASFDPLASSKHPLSEIYAYDELV